MPAFLWLDHKSALRVNFLPILTRHVFINIIECFGSKQTGLLLYKTKLQDVLEVHIKIFQLLKGAHSARLDLASPCNWHSVGTSSQH